jgi:fructokinase
LGIDLGGTKTEIMALSADGSVALRRRIATPKDYDSMLRAIAELVRAADTETKTRGSVGMAIPGSESFGTNLIKNANTTYLIGKPLRLDLEKILERPVRLANDANCFALSEASDGAAKGAATVFGIIAGTGVGGGVVVDGRVLNGAHGIGGEWGHIPLPAPDGRRSHQCAALLLRQARLPGSVVQRAGAGCRFQARHGARSLCGSNRRVRWR